MNPLPDLIARLAGLPVAVVGDVMLDHFLIGRVDRISPEAPVPVVRFEREEFRLGGAANVSHNMHALGASVRLVGLVGRDQAATELGRHLHLLGIDPTGLLTDESRPTTRKMRIVTTRNQQVARIDHEGDLDAFGSALSALVVGVQAAAASSRAIVLSDYRKGVVVPPLIAAAIAAAAARRIPIVIDPKVPQAERYRGASLLTPNHHEAEQMTQTLIRTEADARGAARWLHERTGASILITRGEHGMWVLDASGPSLAEVALPAAAREVADVTGAGDTVVAVVGLALAAGAPLFEAAQLANLAAGLVVGRFGPAVVSPAELASAIPAPA